MGLIRTISPSTEPVSIEEAKSHLRMPDNFDLDDAYIGALIQVAREQVESFTSRALVTQTWEYTLDGFPCHEIQLPVNPVVSVSSIQYVDTAGVTQTWASSKWILDTKGQIARIVPAYNEDYPSTQDVLNSVTITFLAGQAIASVAETYKLAIKVMIAHWYYNRGEMAVLPIAAERLLSPFALMVNL